MPSCGRARAVPRHVWSHTLLAAAGVAVIVLAVAACHGSSGVERLPKPHDLPRTDADARAALLGLVGRGQRATWWVDSSFVRTVDARTLPGDVTEVNRPPDHVVVGLGGASGVVHGSNLSCAPVGGGPVCTNASATAGNGVDTLARLTDATTGTYALRDAPARRIAGLPARCFRMDWNTRSAVQPYGTRAVLCYSDDGIPLALDIDRGNGGDATTARDVRREVTEAQLDALVAPYRGVGPVRPVAPDTSSTTVAPLVPGTRTGQ